jgi:hypothetical protein
MDPAACEKAGGTRTLWRTVVVLAAWLAATLSPGPARALVTLTGCTGGDFGDDCSVAELVAGGSIQIDNTVFDGWSYSGNGITEDTLLVEPLGEGTMDPGPGLRLTGPGVGSDTSVDFALNYDASTGDATRTLEGYTFEISLGQITGAAGAFAATEVVDNDIGKEIACGGLGGGTACEEPIPDQNDPIKSDVFTDEDTGLAVFSKDANVNTNMMAFTGAGESLEFVVLEQSFLVGVPEPAPSLLLATGALVLLGARFARSQRGSRG